jgi:tetratricopeptide (TPR) repeat protein
MKRIVYFLLIFPTLFYSCDEKEKPVKPLTLVQRFKKYPDSVSVLIEYSNTLFKKFEFNKALPIAARAYRLEQKNKEARYIYARCLLNHTKRTEEDIIQAQGHLKAYLKSFPKNTEALVQFAASYFELGDVQKAFQYCNEALRVDMRYRDAYILKGTMYLSQGNNKLAKSSYQTAINQDPQFLYAHLQLGMIYQSEGDTLCFQYFMNAIDLDPSSMDAKYNLAYGYQMLHNTYPNRNYDEQALQVYREMYRQDNTFVMCLFQQGHIKQFQQNQLDSAKQFYNVCLQKEPNFFEAWHNLGVIYEAEGKPLEAINYYKRAVKYNKNFQDSRDAIDRILKKK